jgi:hypothetical protein
MRCSDHGERIADRLLGTEEVGELMGIRSRMVLNLPIPQIRLGPSTIRFRLGDVRVSRRRKPERVGDGFPRPSSAP